MSHVNKTINKQVSIRTIKISLNDRKNYEDFLSKQIIPDPPEELLTVYEKRVLNELSYLRAEKYDSPEHKEELKKIQDESKDSKKVPRNIQNPNYDILMKFYYDIVNSKTLSYAISYIVEMKDFLDSFGLIKSFTYQPSLLSYILDPRCFQNDLEMFLHYLLTKVKHKLTAKECEQFKKLTENKFDEESSEESIYYLKKARNSKDDYENLVDQIYEALGIDDYTYEISDKVGFTIDAKIDVDSEKSTLQDFFNYLYFSDT